MATVQLAPGEAAHTISCPGCGHNITTLDRSASADRGWLELDQWCVRCGGTAARNGARS